MPTTPPPFLISGRGIGWLSSAARCPLREIPFVVTSARSRSPKDAVGPAPKLFVSDLRFCRLGSVFRTLAVPSALAEARCWPSELKARP